MTNPELDAVNRAVSVLNGMNNIIVTDEELETIRAALANAPQWLPIESAPRDGSSLLLCVIGKEPSTGRYAISPMGRSGWICEYPEAFDTEDDLEEYMTSNLYEPTHWMPLPSAPNGGAE